MKKRNIFLLLIALALFIFAFAACGNKMVDSAMSSIEAFHPPNGSYVSSNTAGSASIGGSYDAADMGFDDGFFLDGPSSVNAEDSKLIYTVRLNIETLEYEKSIKAIEQLCKESGGYIEYSYISDSHYNSSALRSSDFALRIPSGKLDEFVNSCGDIGNIYSSNRNVENATAQYVDLSSRLSAYQTEEARLLELLKRAENLEDIISLNARLSEVEYEIDSIKSSLRGIDSLVDYSTVNISLHEVERESLKYDTARTFGQKLSNTFFQSLESFKVFLSRAGVFILGELPFILIRLVIILFIPVLVIILIVHIVKRIKRPTRKSGKHRKSKKQVEISTPSDTESSVLDEKSGE